MDAVEYLRERVRMCESVEGGCGGCRFSVLLNGTVYSCNAYATRYPEEAVRVVEEWSAAHPIKTNAQKFEEVFGVPAHSDYYAGSCWWDEPYVEQGLKNE